jgi:hypothetical protein
VGKAEKLAAALTRPARPSDGRQHYLSESRGGLDPQKLIQGVPWLYAWIKAYLAPTWSFQRWRSHVPDPATATVINLGAGTTRLSPEIINVDFAGFPHIDVVADFNEPLPFKDGSLDAVISISVLEHLEHAERVVTEVARVLKPGGIFYAATPFQYPFHGAPSDFRRWTLPGMKVLLGDRLEIVAQGPRGGAIGVVILALAHAVGQLTCLGSERLYHIVNFGVMGLLAPLKLVDLLVLSHLPQAGTLCPGIFVAARKRA